MNPTYDVNFKHPLPESSLETSRVKLTPFLPHFHTDQLLSILSANPEIERFLAIPFTAEAIDTFGADPESILFAVIDKTKGEHGGEQGAFAGIIGLCNTSAQNLTTEIGGVICFPEFQRTFVNTNAVGILLRYCLNLPEEGGLGFRRVQWAASPFNTSSIRAAERMGMKIEGTLRWLWVLPEGKEGKKPGAGRGEGHGRDSVMLATYWDDWENGGREHVEKIMVRQS
ncbi:acyl-CoA N-acyltransferase [Mycena alexandri]|uniref:Acyl-CoA N-acyltransferase n=1 Tax=Mycena alexandri TaxID=1745969 RepID=A0AAD6SYA7_9AGAR|nr:acyl-CoA N-acyltransferase [Mycena alexandri]